MNAPLWSEEQDNLLRQLRADAVPFTKVAREINKRFGTLFSRNAAIGRAKRLGLAAPRQVKDKKPKRGAARARASLQEFAAAPQSAIEIGATPSVDRRALPAPVVASLTIHLVKKPKKETLSVTADVRPLRPDPVVSRRLSLMDLTEDTCRWPGGGWPSNEPITFCGHAPEADTPYCRAHNQIKRQQHPYAGVPRRDAARANLTRGARASFLTCTAASSEEADAMR